MKPRQRSIRDIVTTPTRVFTIPVKRSRIAGLPQMDTEQEEAWWAEVWRTRGLPDPATVSLADFREAIARERRKADRWGEEPEIDLELEGYADFDY